MTFARPAIGISKRSVQLRAAVLPQWLAPCWLHKLATQSFFLSEPKQKKGRCRMASTLFD
jgi:hypothetical protein